MNEFIKKQHGAKHVKQLQILAGQQEGDRCFLVLTELKASQKVYGLVMYRPVESHNGAPGNILTGPQTFSRGPSGEKIFEFFFSKWYILTYFIFLADGALQTSRGPG